MSPDRRIVRLRPGCSDGDALHVPKQGNHTLVNPPTLYLEKIGQAWMEHRGEAQPGVKYTLESLPYGYTLWHRPRPSKANHLDKYLYGHPGQKFFDSPNRFYPHFQHLMENSGSNIGCPCTVCAGSAGFLPRSTSISGRNRGSSSASSRPSTPKAPEASSMPVRPLPAYMSASQGSTALTVRPAIASAPINQPKGRPKLANPGADSSHVDEEGTPDVYRNFIDKLKRYGTVDEIIEQPLSPDWRAEQKVLPGMLQTLKQQEQWLPRVGEIVLYLRDLPNGVEVVRHEVTGAFQLYNEENEEFLGTPPWEAGLVGEVPEDSSSLSIANLHRGDAEVSVIYSGLRVEPLPNPHDTDKSLSKRYKYVSLRQARPFFLWRELLSQVPQAQWHATVLNALTVSSTLSLIGKYRFRGTWPDAFVYCHGIHLGSEILVVGDTIRLLPNASKLQARCTEVIVVKSIRLKWSGLHLASANDYDEGRPYNSEVLIYGTAYSSDPSAINEKEVAKDNADPPRAGAAYGEWFPLHSSSKELVVPYSRVAGRLYEQDALSFWLNSAPEDRPSLDVGREDILEARAFARQHDQRIANEPGATWYWGDDRADALNLQTINGLEVTKYDQSRDIRALRKHIKILDEVENMKLNTIAKAKAPVTLGSRGLRHFMAPGTGNEHVEGRTERSDELSSGDGMMKSGQNTSWSKKRPQVIDLCDSDEEIRQHTMIVGDTPCYKKGRVAVIVKSN